MSDSQQDEFQKLLHGWCNQTLTDADCTRFEAILLKDRKARRAFRRARNLHAALHERCEGEATFDVTSISSEASRPSLLPWLGIAASVAGILGIAWFTYFKQAPEQATLTSSSTTPSEVPTQFAVLTEAVDLVWENSDDMPHPGGTFDLGEIALKSGWAHIDFFCGANVVLEGPARLEFLSSMKGILHHGKLRARVPEQARGFTITTAQAEVVDLGTEFGIECDPLSLDAEVHVFDGQVEVFDRSGSSQQRRLLNSGSGLKLPPEATWEDIDSDETRFADVADVAERAAAAKLNRAEAWRDQHKNILNRPNLVAYFDFETNQMLEHPCVLQDRGPGQHHGAIVGCSWSKGRWQGKGALEFKQSGDRVRLNVPGSFESLTMMVWMRIDGFDRAFNSILLTDRFDHGHAHWQVRDDGEIDLGIKQLGEHRDLYISEPVLGQCDVGRWLHLAVAYDQEARAVRHYLDGRLVSTTPVHSKQQTLQLGPCEIGNWSPAESPPTAPIRNFNGRIDEFAILHEALDSETISAFYEQGRP